MIDQHRDTLVLLFKTELNSLPRKR